MRNSLEDESREYYRQRGMWFLLLGALLGGIITIALAFAFWLEKWGHHIAADSPGHEYQIAVGLAVGLVISLLVVSLLIWRATWYLGRARRPDIMTTPATPVPE